ncbi:lasso peptide biosynthesis B2 protein [Sphingopyxis sp. OPL5]|uniref:lasso peptide biosynthesis B2 protein n=1 Tax=Sphingopyxis sp. OPL5 TaxID=2486273 RepID=UPI00164E7E94|nr:lasso peptide biosynthesis B2 protein [Sphingopyxis sp. OPL5]QNO25541.1 lasso peptide biosynthesis B2 protein [Sphingopyxis sp. OPL5]
MSTIITDLAAKDALSRIERSEARASLRTGLRIRPQLRVRLIGSRYVFLDLTASRYFLLEGVGAERFASFCDETANDDDIGWLHERRIIELGAPLAPPPLPFPPACSVFDAPPPRARPWLVAEALAEQSLARRRVRQETLAELLKPAEACTFDPDACRAIAAACRAAARYRSAADQCLPNALAMRKMLARRGIGADLVIGVMLPFAAHCWLQSGDLVLSDPFGSVQNFHPLVAT